MDKIVQLMRKNISQDEIRRADTNSTRTYNFDDGSIMKLVNNRGTLTIDGIDYSGTGTVTNGTTTVSLTQGSTMIDVEMDADDVIDEILITFRKEV